MMVLLCTNSIAHFLRLDWWIRREILNVLSDARTATL
jgi:hypothetical protein